ncbi:hypothetical protein [Achromobacter pestifer]|uniref:Uncharacterized protein n=1 Tax=Achromobacter pestifer TaxID=1353889 RepID=A0A6S7A024_9BURK|nr:hypothetical protein [Achromobacter pestifer]CAB3648103.1 hypothetical protein LMG3431_02628 [Achromobacter pestifer]
MTYSGIEKRRFAQLLEWGADDDELRRFFAETRLQLIQRGAKVQNPPHGKPARIRMLAQGLPQATDRVVQKWFGEHLKMLDPKSVDELLADLRLYEEAGESPPEDEAKRLARSCLVHLFSTDPPSDLLSFLRPAQAGGAVDPPEAKEAPMPTPNGQSFDTLSEELGRAIVALAEGRDPDEFLSSLPPSTAAFVAGVQAVRNARYEDVQIAIEALDHQQAVRSLLAEYATRKASARSSGEARGLQMLSFAHPGEAFAFDIDRDEVLAVCTRDFPETTVFLHPSAIRAADGPWIDLSDNEYRKKLFYSSGDLIAFSGGRDIPRQPKRGEIGIWRVAENEGSNPGHRTNFHISSDKTLVYEVRDVPFDSSNHDAVREYIKHAVGEGRTSVTPLLFLLRDQLIVGSPAGKDLTRDEGFDAGLPSWHALTAFRLEGRAFVPGPLPPSGIYECEALASSLRKLFAGEYWGTDKPTKALTRKLQDLIASGAPKLSSERAARLRAELTTIDEHEGAMSALLDEVMRDPRIGVRVDKLVEAKVDLLVAQKEKLHKSVQQLEQKQAELLETRRQAEREQKAIAPAIAKAIRAAFDRARADALGTLGEVVVFKTLIDELVEQPAPPVGTIPPPSRPADPREGTSIVRSAAGAGQPIVETLRALGVTPKAARAIAAVGTMARECGLMLIVDGLAGSVAAEAWLSEGDKSGTVLECGFGETDDRAIRAVLGDAPVALAILDANFSPFDVYARPLVDAVLRRMAGIHDRSFKARVLLSMAEGAAALPLPTVAESLSLRVYLDHIPVFLQEGEAEAWIEEIEDMEEPVEWFAKLWKPAKTKVLNYLRSLPVEEVAIILAALEVAQSSGKRP